MELTENRRREIAVSNSVSSAAASIGLGLLKLLAGGVSGSAALLADAVHSCADAASTLALLMGVRSERDGSSKISRARLGVLFSAGAVVGLGALLLIVRCLKAIGGGEFTKYSVPGIFAAIVALISIAAKEVLFRYTKRDAQRIESEALLNDAWCHRADALSSIVAFMGIVLARCGIRSMDTIACLFVSLFLMKEAYDMIEEGVVLLSTRPIDPDLAAGIEKLAGEDPGVMVTDINCVRRGGDLYVTVEIAVDAGLPIGEAEAIAAGLDRRVEDKYSMIADCIVKVTAREPE